MTKQKKNQPPALVPSGSALGDLLAQLRSAVEGLAPAADTATGRRKKATPIDGDGIAAIVALERLVRQYGLLIAPVAEELSQLLAAGLAVEEAPVELWECAASTAAFVCGSGPLLVESLLAFAAGGGTTLAFIFDAAPLLQCFGAVLDFAMPHLAPAAAGKVAMLVATALAAPAEDDAELDLARVRVAIIAALHCRPAVPALLMACTTAAAQGATSADRELRRACAQLRGTVGTVQHPRCVPLYVPPTVEQPALPTAAPAVPAPAAPVQMTAASLAHGLPAAPAALVVVPSAGGQQRVSFDGKPLPMAVPDRVVEHRFAEPSPAPITPVAPPVIADAFPASAPSLASMSVPKKRSRSPSRPDGVSPTPPPQPGSTAAALPPVPAATDDEDFEPMCIVDDDLE